MNDRDRDFRRLYAELRIRDQQSYLRSRVAEYGSASRQAAVIRNVLLLAAALGGCAGQFTQGSGRAIWAVTSAVLAVLAAALTAYEAFFGFAQQEKRYGDAADNLDEAALDWDEPGGDLTAEVERVEGIFRSETGQWGQLSVRSADVRRPPAPDDPGTA